MSTSDRTPERWFEIALHLCAHDVDAATGLLAAAGFPSCEIIEQDHERERSEIRLHVRCDSLVDARKRGDEIERVLARFDVGAAGLAEIDERIWREDWKRHFQRTPIGKRLAIVPPWDTEEPGARDSMPALEAARITIIINPGLAFGTGQHETTAGCLELLEQIVHAGASVLDLGCGSGILAIAAAKLGAARILAIDNDPEAVRAARENAGLNAVAHLVEVKLAEGAPAAETFDVTVANILAETLVRMAAELTSCVKADGSLVLSGIESTRRPLVEVAFGARGWRLAQVIERSGWASLALARPVGERGRGR